VLIEIVAREDQSGTLRATLFTSHDGL
jgi:hypothetical protein